MTVPVVTVRTVAGNWFRALIFMLASGCTEPAVCAGGRDRSRDQGGGRKPNEDRIAWPSGPANQVRKACAAAAFLDALTTTPE